MPRNGQEMWERKGDTYWRERNCARDENDNFFSSLDWTSTFVRFYKSGKSKQCVCDLWVWEEKKIKEFNWDKKKKEITWVLKKILI